MTRTRRGLIAASIAILAVGIATGLTIALTAGPGSSPSTSAGDSAGASAGASAGGGSDNYGYYQSMMGGLAGGSMMGGAGQAMMGQSGYSWMAGGADAPGWMTGGALPGSMMQLGADPGTIMGKFWADAPGPRTSAADATTLGNQTPAGATIDTAARRLTFTTHTVHLVVLASPAMPDENFRIAGMTNPTIVIPAGAHVVIELINADTDMAHGLVITSNADTATTSMPMMTAPPVFPGSALWFLGESTPAGMHTGTLTFTATTPGSYHYLCPVPGHAQEGMIGNLTVTT